MAKGYSARPRGKSRVLSVVIAVVIGWIPAAWPFDGDTYDPFLESTGFDGNPDAPFGESPDSQHEQRASEETGEQWPLGGAGYALSFDGQDDWVEVDGNPLPSLTGTNQLTMEAWVYRRPSGEYWQCLLSKGRDQPYGLTVSKDEFLHFELETSKERKQLNAPKESVPFRSWTHVAGAWDGATMRAYVNGVEMASYEIPGTLKSTTQRLIIGAGGPHGFEGWNGIIDEVRIWSVARTRAEINRDMNRSLIGTEPGLVAYWDFDEAKGQICHDLSGNGSNLRLGSSPDADDSDPGWVVSGAPINMGKCVLAFDGVDDYVDIEQDLPADMIDSFTIEGWVQFEEDGKDHQSIVSIGSATAGCELIASSTDSRRKLGLVVKSQDQGSHTVMSNAALSPDRWDFVAATYDAGAVRLFVNGQEDVSERVTGQLATHVSGIRIGSSSGSGLDLFRGQIDDLSIWSVARSESEIRDSMYRGISGYEPRLVASWNFDQPGGQFCYDSSPNRMDGQLGSSPEEDENDPRWVCIVRSEVGKITRQAEKVSIPRRHPVRGKVLDARGNPLREVLICSIYNDPITMTDKSGRFEWSTDSPKTQAVCFMKQQFFPEQVLVSPGSDKEIVVILKPELRLYGTVTDALTGEPVPEFTIAPGIVSDNPSFEPWDDTSRVTCTGGSYSISFGRSLHIFIKGDETHPIIHDLSSDTHHAHRIRVQADGYQTAVSPAYRDHGDFDESVEYNVVLYPIR